MVGRFTEGSVVVGNVMTGITSPNTSVVVDTSGILLPAADITLKELMVATVYSTFSLEMEVVGLEIEVVGIEMEVDIAGEKRIINERNIKSPKRKEEITMS